MIASYARKLAELLRTNQLKPVYHGEHGIRTLKELGRSYLTVLCADDIELWPPDTQPLLGRAAVSAQMAHGTTRIHCIEITGRRIRGSNETAYLTASYKTTFSSAEDPTPRQALGSHLWILRKRAGTWVVILVSWSLWGGAAISGT